MEALAIKANVNTTCLKTPLDILWLVEGATVKWMADNDIN